MGCGGIWVRVVSVLRNGNIDLFEGVNRSPTPNEWRASDCSGFSPLSFIEVLLIEDMINCILFIIICIGPSVCSGF